MKKIGVTTECVCDLPESYFEQHEVPVVYFYIRTETGRFRDVYEVTAGNIIEYLEQRKKISQTSPPDVEEFVSFFRQGLKQYEEIIHISITEKVSRSYSNAMEAVRQMGEEGRRVHLVDSMHLSTGMGHLVVNAVEMRDDGLDATEILTKLDELKKKISTSFIAPNAEYLYNNGKVGKFVRNLCSVLQLHPVLKMKDGRIVLAGIEVGKYHKAVMRYVRRQLKNARRIEKKRLFITHTGFPVRFITRVKEEIERQCDFEEMIVTKASATISCNCGVETIGVLFVNQK